MNRLKDFIYNKNDIVIALVIVVIAAYIIVERIDTIMDYPAMMTALASEEKAELESGSSVTPQPPPAQDSEEGDSDEEPDPPIETETPDNSDVADKTTGEPSNRQVSIYIEYGSSGSDIAQLIVDSGLLESRDAFYDAVAASGADTKLQAGSFKIPANATPEEIIRIITK